MLTMYLIAVPLGLAVPPVADGAPSDEAIRVNAYVMAEELEVGKSYELAVEIELASGLSLTDAGIPAPVLQIDVPPSIQLEGKVLTT